MTQSVSVDDVAAFDQKRVPNPEAAKLQSYPLLDWLRFVLAAVVVLQHDHVALPGPIDGMLAVQVFLALSGWLIGGILLRSERRDLPRFFFNRATRIWIPYAATFAAIYGLAALRDGIDLHWWKYAFYDATFTHYTWTVFPRAGSEMPLGGTGNHFWSISVEEQFYLAAPLLIFAGAWGKKLIPWLAVGAILLMIGSMFAPVALGVVAAILQREHGDWQQSGAARILLPLAAIATLALLWRWNTPQLQAIFAVLTVLALARVGRRGKAGLFVGAISYPVYLNHWIGAFAINAIAHFVPMPDAPHKALTFLAGIAAGTAAWWLIDRNIMARRAAFYTPARGRALAIAAYALLAIGLSGGLAIRAMGG